MFQKTSRWLGGAMLLGAIGLPQAYAADDVIDFEAAALLGAYSAGDTFISGAYTLTTRIDYGVIDGAVALGPNSPTGNATQFYFNGNDGALSIVRTDAGLFDLAGFAAAFVPLDPPSSQTTVIVAKGTKVDNSVVTVSWAFASSATSHFPFASYSTPSQFSALVNLKQVDFMACSWDGVTPCTQPTLNNGQFAIDDVALNVALVPEPAALGLFTLGLLGVGLRTQLRRKAR